MYSRCVDQLKFLETIRRKENPGGIVYSPKVILWIMRMEETKIMAGVGEYAAQWRFESVYWNVIANGLAA